MESPPNVARFHAVSMLCRWTWRFLWSFVEQRQGGRQREPEQWSCPCHGSWFSCHQNSSNTWDYWKMLKEYRKYWHLVRFPLSIGLWRLVALDFAPILTHGGETVVKPWWKPGNCGRSICISWCLHRAAGADSNESSALRPAAVHKSTPLTPIQSLYRWSNTCISRIILTCFDFWGNPPG